MTLASLVAGTAAFLMPPGNGDRAIVELPANVDLSAGPYCDDAHAFCLTRESLAAGYGLYVVEPHIIFRQRNCQVHWRAVNPGLEERVPEGGFRSPCSGATFDALGQLVFGPSPRGLDRFPVRRAGAAIVVDTRSIACRPGLSAMPRPSDCQAPAGLAPGP